MMLDQLVDVVAEEFGVVEIENRELLTRCKRTAFSWTRAPGALTLADDVKHLNHAVDNPNVAGIITSTKTASARAIEGKALVVAEHPRSLFFYIHNQKIHETLGAVPFVPSFRSDSATVAPSAVVEENVSLGDNVVISHGAIVLANTVVEANSIISAGAILGAQGIFEATVNGKRVHVEHFGGVKVGSNSVIHAGAVVIKAAPFAEFTSVGNGVHIGIRASIGHDSVIGHGGFISSGSVISGRVEMGEDCWIGANCAISHGRTLGDHVRVQIGSVVISDVPSGRTVSGNFAMDHHRNLTLHIKSRNT